MPMLQKKFYTKKSVQTMQNSNMQKEKFEKAQMQKLYPKMQKKFSLTKFNVFD